MTLLARLGKETSYPEVADHRRSDVAPSTVPFQRELHELESFHYGITRPSRRRSNRRINAADVRW